MQIKLWATTCYFWKALVGPLGSVSSTVPIPFALPGRGDADGELLQRHSRDSAGAGKSRPSSWDGRCRSLELVLVHGKCPDQGKAGWEARCSRPGAGSTSGI